MAQEKLSDDELHVVQKLYIDLQVVQAQLQGALNVLAAIHQIPDGGSIDPATGIIIRPVPKEKAE